MGHKICNKRSELYLMINCQPACILIASIVLLVIGYKNNDREFIIAGWCTFASSFVLCIVLVYCVKDFIRKHHSYYYPEPEPDVQINDSQNLKV